MTLLQARKLPLLLTIVLGLASAHCAATTEEGDVEVDRTNANAVDEQATTVTGDTTTTTTTGDEAADKKKPKTQQQVYLKVELKEVMVSSF